MKRTGIFILAWFVLSAAAQSVQTGLLSINEADLRAEVTYLASKELKGRGDGSAELRVAAEHIAEAFRKSGVKPAGDAGSYFQNFQMFTTRLASAPEFRVDRSVLRLGS